MEKTKPDHIDNDRDPQALNRNKAKMDLQLNDLGVERRDVISTQDEQGYTKRKMDLQLLDKTKRANVPGTREAELTKKNKTQISLWKNAASLGLIEADQEALKLDELNSGQTHRIALSAALAEISQKDRASQGTFGKPIRAGKKVGRGGGVVGTRARGDFQTSQIRGGGLSIKGAAIAAGAPPKRGQRGNTGHEYNPSSDTKPTVWEILEDSTRSPPWRPPAKPTTPQREKGAQRLASFTNRDTPVPSRPRHNQNEVPQLADPASFLAVASAQFSVQPQAQAAPAMLTEKLGKPQDSADLELKTELNLSKPPANDPFTSSSENKTAVRSRDAAMDLVDIEENNGIEPKPLSPLPPNSMYFQDLVGLDFTPSKRASGNHDRQTMPVSDTPLIDTATESSFSDTASSDLSQILIQLRNLKLEDQVSVLEEQLHRVRGEISASRITSNEAFGEIASQKPGEPQQGAESGEGDITNFQAGQRIETDITDEPIDNDLLNDTVSQKPETSTKPHLLAQSTVNIQSRVGTESSSTKLSQSALEKQNAELAQVGKIADIASSTAKESKYDAFNPRLPLAASRYAHARSSTRSRTLSSSSLASIIGDHQLLPAPPRSETGSVDQTSAQDPKLTYPLNESASQKSDVADVAQSRTFAPRPANNDRSMSSTPTSSNPAPASPKQIVAGLVGSRWGKEIQFHSDTKKRDANIGLTRQPRVASPLSGGSVYADTPAINVIAPATLKSADTNLSKPKAIDSPSSEAGDQFIGAAASLASRPTSVSSSLLGQRPQNIQKISSANNVETEMSRDPPSVTFSNAPVLRGPGGLGGGMSESKYSDAWRPPSPPKSKQLLGLRSTALAQNVASSKKENKKP